MLLTNNADLTTAPAAGSAPAGTSLRRLTMRSASSVARASQAGNRRCDGVTAAGAVGGVVSTVAQALASAHRHKVNNRDGAMGGRMGGEVGAEWVRL